MTMLKDLPPDDLNNLAHVLQDIKQLAFYAKDGDSVIYPSSEDLKKPLNEHSLLSGEKRFYVFAIQEEGGIKVLHEHTIGRSETPYRWTVEVDMPKLRELESKVKQLYIGDSKPVLDSKSEELEQWLASKPERAIRRIWRVVRALDYEWSLRDQDRFKIPHDKFEMYKVTKTNDLEAILTTLHNKGFIFVSRKTAQQPPSDDPNKPGGMSLWQPITEYPQMIKWDDTEIEIFPQKFKQLYEILKRIVEHIDSKKPDIISAETKDLTDTASRHAYENTPYSVVEKGMGFLKFGKHGSKKKIGKANSRSFKFLQVTIEPIDVFKSVDAVFTAIWMEKDKQDSRLTNPSTAQTRKVEIIKNSAIKELQKGDKLGKKIKFEFNQSKTQVKAVLVE